MRFSQCSTFLWTFFSRDDPSVPLTYFYNIQPEMINETIVTSLWNAGNIALDRAENVYQTVLGSNASLSDNSDSMIILVGNAARPRVCGPV